MSIAKIHMVDLQSQYLNIKKEVDQRIGNVLQSSTYINGPEVKQFESNLAEYLNVKHVIACGNGTDALQIALMALDLAHGDEIIVPAFTYVATAEVIALLGLTPILVDIDIKTFNTTAKYIQDLITDKTKVIMPVHLYGQPTEMNEILSLAKERNIYIIEDNAQAIGANYTLSNGQKTKAGTIGHIGCTSFYPSKNLGCYGDGGAIFTQDDRLAAKLRMIANHGQSKRYYHDVIGCNSRLDSIQAAVLNVKLQHLDRYNQKRKEVAQQYTLGLGQLVNIETPFVAMDSDHVYHQYTIKVKNGKRDELKKHLEEYNIPSSIFYPLPLYKQNAFSKYTHKNFTLANTEILCTEVLSLPIHTEMKKEALEYIIHQIIDFFERS